VSTPAIMSLLPYAGRIISSAELSMYLRGDSFLICNLNIIFFT
jgi:hypothetical protein